VSPREKLFHLVRSQADLTSHEGKTKLYFFSRGIKKPDHLDVSRDVEMVWFGSLVRCRRLRDNIPKKIVWFGFLVRSWSDFGPS